MPKPRGQDHPHWKGDEAQYGTIHRWINLNFPRAGRCEKCGVMGCRTEYASIGHSYTRNREDWLELCICCHARSDRRGAYERTSEWRARLADECWRNAHETIEWACA